MSLLTSAFLNRTRNRWLKWLVKFQYYDGSTWRDAEIVNKEVSGDSLIITTTTTDAVAMTITKIRVYDNNGDLALEAPESLVKTESQSVLIQWKFPLNEVDS